MKKLSEVVNIKIYNFVNFDGWNLSKNEVLNFLKNLTYNDITLNNFNDFEFKKYGETVRVFIFVDSYDTIVFNIDEIF